MQLIWPGALAAQAVYVAAKLQIADLLGDETMTADELARLSESDSAALYRTLRALTSLGVFEEPTPRSFRNSELSNAMRSDAPGSARPWPLFLISPFNWKLWGNLEETVRTGEAAAERVYGKPFWEYLAEHPEDAAIFNAAMTSRSDALSAAVVASYDFSRFATIVDVGGGRGRLLQGILAACPESRGVLFDLAQTVADTTFLQEQLAEGRAQIVSGSFMESVPAGGDAYILSGIINDWNDRDARTILRNCRRAIAPSGRLLLVTSVQKPSTAPADRGSFMDIYMMLYGGRDRSEEELRLLLREAGFAVVRLIPTPTLNVIVECEPSV